MSIDRRQSMSLQILHFTVFHRPHVIMAGLGSRFGEFHEANSFAE
jgi:hypothetical protein